MATQNAKRPVDVKLIVAILASSADVLKRAHNLIEHDFGPIDIMSNILPFKYTQYYNNEMGDGILRQFVSFEHLVFPGKLCCVKKRTNEIEDTERLNGKRIMNIDPGYLTLSSLIVASTKEACYRIYLDDGIYAQPMLHFRKNEFIPFEFTYPDYADAENRAFFSRVRDIYHQQLKNSQT